MRSSQLSIALLAAFAAPAAAQVVPPPIVPPPEQRPPIHIPPHRIPPRHVPRPHPMVKTEATKVACRIVDGVADTKVTMTFRNEGATIGEAIVLFPLPAGATADKLEMMVGGKLVSGEVLDKRKARGVYESIVRRRRDPALLEYMGRDVLRLRVFPIPPKASQDVKVRFRLLLPESGGLYRYEFPTRAVGQGTFAIDIGIDSQKALKNVYTPIAGFDVSRADDHHARASFESKGRPQRDPILFYALSDRDFGLNLLTHRQKGKDEGSFLVMIAPKRDWKSEKELAKSISFVLDTSGSMQGEKIAQAKRALKFFLESLKEGDVFNVIPFSTEARPFAQKPVAVSPDEIARAVKFAGELEARGGTNIEEALRLALAQDASEDRVPMTVFLTDGLPTVGITDVKEILKSAQKANAARARVFVFGVGNDVNTRLLDKLSEQSRGTRDYVRPGENLEVKLSALFEKLAHPVLSDIELVVGAGVRVSRVVPARLPDLFRGSRLVVAGRYKGSGAVAIRLGGKVGGEAKEYVFDATFPEEAPEHDFVSAIWAQRRVGVLLDAIRLNGSAGQNGELVNEIRRLGTTYGIVTPYTSHLIVEEGERIASLRRGVDLQGFGQLQGGGGRRPGTAGPMTPGAPAETARVRRELDRAGYTGPADAVPPEAEGKALAKAKKALQNYGRAQSGSKAIGESRTAARLYFLDTLAKRGKDGVGLWRSQRIGGRVFHLAGSVWIDGKYRKEHEKHLRKIVAFSDDYFALLAQHPELRKALAFSTAIVLVLGPDEAVEILPAQSAGELPKAGK